MSTTLYRFFNSQNDLLYVGISMNFASRIRSHKSERDWFTQIASITLEHYETREDAVEAEKQAITQECPRHNVAHNQARAETLSVDALKTDYHCAHIFANALMQVSDAIGLRSISVEVINDFCELIATGIDKRDYCTSCRDLGVSFHQNVYLPISLTAQNNEFEAFYLCRNEHLWTCYWKGTP
jgi:predicted GIY-YIG superfamily endonuclease